MTLQTLMLDSWTTSVTWLPWFGATSSRGRRPVVWVHMLAKWLACILTSSTIPQLARLTLTWQLPKPTLDPITIPLVSNMVRFISTLKQDCRILTIGIGSWAHPLEPGESSASTFLNSHKQETRAPLNYSTEDLEQIEKWGKSFQMTVEYSSYSNHHSSTPRRNHLALSGHLQHGSQGG